MRGGADVFFRAGTAPRRARGTGRLPGSSERRRGRDGGDVGLDARVGRRARDGGAVPRAAARRAARRHLAGRRRRRRTRCDGRSPRREDDARATRGPRRAMRRTTRRARGSGTNGPVWLDAGAAARAGTVCDRARRPRFGPLRPRNSRRLQTVTKIRSSEPQMLFFTLVIIADSAKALSLSSPSSLLLPPISARSPRARRRGRNRTRSRRSP